MLEKEDVLGVWGWFWGWFFDPGMVPGIVFQSGDGFLAPTVEIQSKYPNKTPITALLLRVALRGRTREQARPCE